MLKSFTLSTGECMSVYLNLKMTLLLIQVILILSLIAILSLFLIYTKHNLNFPVRSCCGVIIVTNLLLLMASFYPNILYSHPNLCLFQATLLNYTFHSFHGHLAFLMFNNCLQALRFKALYGITHLQTNFMWLGVCFVFPVFPVATIILIRVFKIKNLLEDVWASQRAFFCILTDPRGNVTTWWTMFFSVPGFVSCSFLAILVLKTFLSQKTSSKTHFSLSDVFRMFTALICYAAMSVIGYNHHSILLSEEMMLRNLESIQNLYTKFEPSMCLQSAMDNKDRVLQALRCPSFRTFTPTFVGILFFIMYGFSKNAVLGYKQFFGFLTRSTFGTKKAARRLSSMPMLENDSNAKLHPRSTSSNLIRRNSEPLSSSNVQAIFETK